MEAFHRYDDIINLPHPVSKKHPQMPLTDRAAQFAPFAALTGYDAAIAETATVVQPCSPQCGRSVSLLPSVHIAIIYADTIVSAMRDVLARFEEDRAAGKDIASQTVFISGPSNTSDIELVRVDGVHGPTKVTYIIVED